ncbi:uncharacterized protein LOC120535957 [Polypterus senegalus]|uniref:uncharacterized protein LOC120535957 n=1 Tax=Polypterus senegalus TaxID=55291 RepID=UPI0019663CB7|nr:uncharacterized protein LOC120535957 [Polypterus senegalus]
MLLLFALTFAAPSRGQRQDNDIEFLSLPHQTMTIYGVLGDNITLSCSFRRRGEWFRAYWYENDTVNREVKPTCSITDSDRNISTCTLSFILHNISLAQSGRSYKCVVENVEEQPPKLWTDQSQTFYVRAAPSRPTVSSEGGQVLGYKLNISCLAHRFYPSNISMTWFLNHQPVIATDVEDVTMNADGTFTAVSHLSFLLTAEHLSGTVTCQVSHEALQQPLKTDLLLDVKYGPRLIRILHRTSSEANFQEIPSSPVRVLANSYFELRCTADSNPNSSIYWTSARGQGRIDQAHGRELSWTHIQEAQSNDYWCLAENALGNASKSITLVVLQPDGLSPLKLLTVVIVVITLILILLAIFFYVINNWKQTGEPHPARSSSSAPVSQKEESSTESAQYEVIYGNDLTSKAADADVPNDYEIPYADIVISARDSGMLEDRRLPEFVVCAYAVQDEGTDVLNSAYQFADKDTKDRLQVGPLEVTRKLSTGSEYAVINYSSHPPGSPKRRKSFPFV